MGPDQDFATCLFCGGAGKVDTMPKRFTLRECLMKGAVHVRNPWYREGHILRFMPEEQLFLDTSDGTICGVTEWDMEGWEIVT
jgi:hypothetical protein